MSEDKTSAAYYDTIKRGVELPGDPKPCSKTAIKARKTAIREGRLQAPSRDDVIRAMAREAAPFNEEQAAIDAAAKAAAAEERNKPAPEEEKPESEAEIAAKAAALAAEAEAQALADAADAQVQALEG